MSVDASAAPWSRVFLVVALAVVWGACGSSGGDDFDPALWRNAPQGTGDGPARIDMVDDLLRRHRLVGQSREKVVALLGESDDTDYFAEYDLVYRLGLERSFIAVDSEWLVLRLDEDGVVSERRVVTD